MTQLWTVDGVRRLGVTTDIVTAGSVLGLSRNVSYQLAAVGLFPVKVLHLGARYRVPVAALLKLLEIEPFDQAVRGEAGPAALDPEEGDAATSRSPVVSKLRRG